MKIEANKEYIGRVIYIDDVTRSGRCKVRVSGLFNGIPDSNIPWFSPKGSASFSGSGGGSLDVPKIGSIVSVSFDRGCVYAGQYTSMANADPAMVNEVKEDYEGSHMIMHDSAEQVAMMYQPMSGLKIYHKGGSIIIDPNGNIQIKHQNNTNIIEINDNDITITAGSGGSINISSNSEINLTAPTINLDGENINLGHAPVKSVVSAEDLIPILNMMKNNIIAKMPYGSPDLAPETFTSMSSNNGKMQ